MKSDGTSAGTVLVKDIRPAIAMLTRGISRTSTDLVFPGNDGTNGAELWKSDGSSEGPSSSRISCRVSMVLRQAI